MESVASNPPSAMTDVDDGELGANIVLVDAMVEGDKSAEEGIFEEKVVDELTTCVEDSTEVATSGVEVMAVDATLEIINEGVSTVVEDASVVELAMEFEESVDSALLELGMA